MQPFSEVLGPSRELGAALALEERRPTFRKLTIGENIRRSPSNLEQERIGDLMRMVPRGHHTVLDAGAGAGYNSIRLAEYFDSVTALDMKEPEARHERVRCAAGDLTRLAYPDRSFDVVVCSEVLEHIAALEKAVGELKRVAKYAIVIGVPYKQDIRVGRATCVRCGKSSPPWGHVNVFDDDKLRTLFQPFRVTRMSLAGLDTERTNSFAAWLTDLGKNPYGIYGREQRCLHCGAALETRPSPSFIQKVCGTIGVRLMKFQSARTTSHANWIHMLFER